MSLRLQTPTTLRLDHLGTSYVFTRRPTCFVFQSYWPERKEFSWIQFADADVRTASNDCVLLEYEEATRTVFVYTHPEGARSSTLLLVEVGLVSDEVDAFFKPSYIFSLASTVHEVNEPRNSGTVDSGTVDSGTVDSGASDYSVHVVDETLSVTSSEHSFRFHNDLASIVSFVYDEDWQRFEEVCFRSCRDQHSETLTLKFFPRDTTLCVFAVDSVTMCTTRVAQIALDPNDKELLKFLIPRHLRALI